MVGCLLVENGERGGGRERARVREEGRDRQADDATESGSELFSRRAGSGLAPSGTEHTLLELGGRQ